MLQRWLPMTFTLALLALIGWIAARWFWILMAPSPAPLAAPLAAEARNPVDAVINARPFGAVAVTSSTPSPQQVGDLILRGISSTRRGGIAIIAVDKGRTVAVNAGDEIAPGIRLERVLPDHVIVNRAGVPQRLELPQRKSTHVAPVKPGAAR